MSNLEFAKAALEAELAQAKQGFAFYQSRIDALNQTLEQLNELDAPPIAQANSISPLGKRGRKSKKIAAPKVRQTQRRGKETGDNELPFTGGDYWPNLVTSQPQSGADILHAAIAKLGFPPTKLQVQKLTNRLTFALHALVRTGRIKDSGSGRERRFFKS